MTFSFGISENSDYECENPFLLKLIRNSPSENSHLRKARLI